MSPSDRGWQEGVQGLGTQPLGEVATAAGHRLGPKTTGGPTPSLAQACGILAAAVCAGWMYREAPSFLPMGEAASLDKERAGAEGKMLRADAPSAALGAGTAPPAALPACIPVGGEHGSPCCLLLLDLTWDFLTSRSLSSLGVWSQCRGQQKGRRGQGKLTGCRH